MQTRTAFCQARDDRMPSTNREKEQDVGQWEENIRKADFGRISWEDMLTLPKIAQKAAQFIKSLGLIDQFKSVTLD